MTALRTFSTKLEPVSVGNIPLTLRPLMGTRPYRLPTGRDTPGFLRHPFHQQLADPRDHERVGDLFARFGIRGIARRLQLSRHPADPAVERRRIGPCPHTPPDNPLQRLSELFLKFNKCLLI